MNGPLPSILLRPRVLVDAIDSSFAGPNQSGGDPQNIATEPRCRVWTLWDRRVHSPCTSLGRIRCF